MTPGDDRIAAWFRRQAERDARTVRLEDALLGGRMPAYLAYRLRFFGLRYVVASVVQLIKVLYLHRLLGATGFTAVVMVVAVSGLLTGAWWGALEVLRTRVRALYRVQSAAVVGREIGRWIVAGARLGIAIAVGGLVTLLVVGVGRAATPFPAPPEAVALAVGALLLRVAVELPIRAYHAGAFALRRIYRPWGTILALEALGLAAMVALVPLIGAYAVGVSEIVMAAGFAAVTVRYAARTHRQLGLAPERAVTVRMILGRSDGRAGREAAAGHRRLDPRTVRRWAAEVREVAPPAAAGLVMSVDSLLVLAVLGAASAAGEGWLALLMAGISPTLRAGFDWALLVYFDLKRLDAPLFANLRRRLDAATFRLAVLLGILLGLVGVAIAVGPLGLPPFGLAILLPITLGASLLGLWQMEAFTETAYRRVVLAGGVMLVGLAAMTPAARAGIAPLAWLAGAVCLAAAVAWLLRRPGISGGAVPEPLLPTAWLAGLREEAGVVALAVVRVRASGADARSPLLADPGRLRDWRATDLARRLARRLGRRGAVTVLDGTAVAWFQRGIAGPPATIPADGTARHRPWNRRRGGRRADVRSAVLDATGRLAAVHEAIAPSGAVALAQLAAWGVLPAASAGPDSRDTIVRAFRERVPEGFVFDPGRPAPAALIALPPPERRLVLWNAIRHARTLTTRPDRGALDVTCWVPDGALDLVFVVPRRVGPRRIARWRQEIRAANVRAAAGRTSVDAPPVGVARPAPSPERDLRPATADPRGAMVSVSIRGPAPAALATPVATEHRRG